MQGLSDASIKSNCPHCDFNSQAFKFPIEETKQFFIVADAHPVCEGHILLISKKHISCVGEYSEKLMVEFKELYQKISDFIKKTYGSVSVFEHGVFGQTVFHSHIHFLPFKGDPTLIIPEGKEKITAIHNLKELDFYLKKDHGYLFFSIEKKMWVVDPFLASPRFFRDRFAKAIGRPERSDWKAMANNPIFMKAVEHDDFQTQAKWLEFFR
ncbi:HIT domain-containing protein [Candidatus Beckwithbacteria bacterium]|nr:HIT domain-containing protein [Candidatus Beckwithbacteria bacterium]